MQSGELTKPFCVEEVRQVVWDCDAFKNPGPNGINFGFIKDFWCKIKEDFMSFIELGSYLKE